MKKLWIIVVTLLLLGVLAGCLTGLMVKFTFDGQKQKAEPHKHCCEP